MSVTTPNQTPAGENPDLNNLLPEQRDPSTEQAPAPDAVVAPEVEGAPQPILTPVEETAEDTSPHERPNRRRGVIASIVVGALAVSAGAAFLLNRGGHNNAPQNRPTAAASPNPGSTPTVAKPAPTGTVSPSATSSENSASQTDPRPTVAIETYAEATQNDNPDVSTIFDDNNTMSPFDIVHNWAKLDVAAINEKDPQKQTALLSILYYGKPSQNVYDYIFAKNGLQATRTIAAATGMTQEQALNKFTYNEATQVTAVKHRTATELDVDITTIVFDPIDHATILNPATRTEDSAEALWYRDKIVVNGAEHYVWQRGGNVDTSASPTANGD